MVPDDGSARRDAGRRPPDAGSEPNKTKPEDRPVTVGELQALISGMTKTIIGGFSSTKNDLERVVGSFNARYLELVRRSLTKEQVEVIARNAVPACLRNLDSSQRQGIVLMLAPGQAGGQDSAYFGTVKAEGAAVPDSPWAFGVKEMSVATATFHGGPMMKATNEAIMVAEQNCTITQQGQVVYGVYTLATGVAGFGIANAANFPRSGSGTFVKPLQSFNLVDGVITPLFTYHRGVIQIDGIYA